ncbi:MAG TPA: hypothetical protein VFG52_05150 [Xanthomonadales bacterium]|nr:hypothetical protein [Xanthomonadales bacterium]
MPSAIFMVLAWWHLRSLGSWPRRLGMIGAGFFLVYAAALGTEGDFYPWMRRYGVVFYFGLTGLAQLLLARTWLGLPTRPSRLGVYLAMLALTWAAGIGSALKRTVIENPVTISRVENVLEWWFALGLSLGFLAIAAVIHRPQSQK